MTIRLAWSILTVFGVGGAVWQLLSPSGNYPLSCSKTGGLIEPGVPAEATCHTSVLEVISPWSAAVIALVVAAPPVVAALIHRVWMSWITIFLLLAVGAVGVGHWTSFWMILAVCAFPMAFVALIIASVHLGLATRRRSRRYRSETVEAQRI